MYSFLHGQITWSTTKCENMFSCETYKCKNDKKCIQIYNSSCESLLPWCSDSELSMLSARKFKSVSRKHLINVCHVMGILPLPCSHCSRISTVISTGSWCFFSMMRTLLPSLSFRSCVPKRWQSVAIFSAMSMKLSFTGKRRRTSRAGWSSADLQEKTYPEGDELWIVLSGKHHTLVQLWFTVRWMQLIWN